MEDKRANPSFWLSASIQKKKHEHICCFYIDNVSKLMTPDWRFWWEPSDGTSGAAQRVLNRMDSWLSASPVVCVLAQQCLYPRRQNSAPGLNTRSQAMEFLQTPLIPIFLFPKNIRHAEEDPNIKNLYSFGISQQVRHRWEFRDIVD